MEIRQYTQADREAVIQLLNLNTPEFFDESEKQDLEKYLDEEVEDYFVVEENDQIVGSGGINYFHNENKARISWDIINPNSQGKGIGGKLTKHRIEHINRNDKIDTIIVRTSQLAFEFYEKMGFELIKVESDFWSEGYDLYLMELRKENIGNK